MGGSMQIKGGGGVGFRKLTLFNKAMLAKQAWRIISSPNSLVARVLKARYFKHTDVMDAGIRNNPSFVWRSLCWGRGVLNGGMFWHLDKGGEVRLFSDKWVPSLPGGKPVTWIATNSRVATYITEDGHWDLGLLNQAFLPFEVDKIRQVHIANSGEGDMRYWKDDLKGKYSVKSGYLQEATLDKLRRDKGEASNKSCMKKWWQLLWGLRVPPKIRIFVWKLSHDILCTEGNLSARHIPCDECCFVCHARPASSVHVLFRCKSIKEYWHRRGISTSEQEDKPGGLIEILHRLVWKDKVLPLDELAMTLWGIWRGRCELQHEQHASKKGKAMLKMLKPDWAIEYLQEYQSSCSMIERMHQANPTVLKMWEFPLGEISFTIRAYARYDEDKAEYALGIWGEDAAGNFLFAAGKVIMSPGSVLAGEMHAVIFAMETAQLRGWERVLIYSDSHDLVRACLSHEQYSGPVETYRRKMRQHLVQGGTLGIQLISRKRNYGAHTLARHAARINEAFEWNIETAPTWLFGLISRDKSGLY